MVSLIKNFFLVTIGYIMAVAAVAVYFGEYLMENLHKMNLVSMGVYIIVGYVAALVGYSILTYIQYSVKYYRAKKALKILHTAYRIKQDLYTGRKRSAGRGTAGGNRK